MNHFRPHRVSVCLQRYVWPVKISFVVSDHRHPDVLQ